MALTVARAFRRSNLLADSRRSVWCAAILIVLCAGGVARAEQPYSVRRLNVPMPYYGTRYYAINDRGDVAGNMANGQADRAYLISDGQLVMLPGSANSQARGMNNLGQVVGIYGFQGFLWNEGARINLGAFGPVHPGLNTSFALAINDAGQIVGLSEADDHSLRAFLISPQNGVWFRDDDADGVNDLMLDLGAFGEYWSEAVAINNAGRIVGTYRTVDDDKHAFLWHEGQMTELGTLGGSWSWAVDITNSGQVLVRSADAQGVERIGLITPDGAEWNRDLNLDGANDLMTIVQPPDPNNVYLFAVNALIEESGRVVGIAGNGFPFRWEAGVTQYLNDFLTDPSWFSPHCSDSNASGSMVCAGWTVQPPFVEDVVVLSLANPSVRGTGSRYLEATVPPGTTPASLKVTTADGSCVLGYVQSDGRVGDLPFVQPCDAWNVVNIRGVEIAPEVGYRVHLDLGAGVVGTSEVVTPMKWADAVAPFGVVNFRDVTAIVKRLQGLSGAPPLTACDLGPAMPNGFVNFQDVGSCVQAFQARPYPFSVPGPCP